MVRLCSCQPERLPLHRLFLCHCGHHRIHCRLVQLVLVHRLCLHWRWRRVELGRVYFEMLVKLYFIFNANGAYTCGCRLHV